jgi:hypothetical protein
MTIASNIEDELYQCSPSEAQIVRWSLHEVQSSNTYTGTDSPDAYTRMFRIAPGATHIRRNHAARCASQSRLCSSQIQTSGIEPSLRYQCSQTTACPLRPQTAHRTFTSAHAPGDSTFHTCCFPWLYHWNSVVCNIQVAHKSSKPPPVTTLAHVVHVRLRQSIIPLPFVTVVTFPDIFHG